MNENQFQNYLRIIENQRESSRINENQFHTDLRISKNHWESISHLFENQLESSKIGENHWESYKKKGLTSLMVWGQMTQIYEDQCIYSNSHWSALILWIIIIFPHSQIHWIDHIAVLADSNYYFDCIQFPECTEVHRRMYVTFKKVFPFTIRRMYYSVLTFNWWISISIRDPILLLNSI